MLPTLRSGDRVLFEQSKKNAVGDILFGRDGERFVAHRLLGNGITKGDRSGCYDGDFVVMGKVVGYIHQGTPYYWGEKGQPFKKVIAFLSSYTTFDRSRLIRRFFLLLIVFFSLWRKTSRDHTK